MKIIRKKGQPCALEHILSLKNYERMEPTSLLEMSLWKEQRSNDGTERQALDEGECLCVCGSDVVISNVVEFLYIHMGPPNATH